MTLNAMIASCLLADIIDICHIDMTLVILKEYNSIRYELYVANTYISKQIECL